MLTRGAAAPLDQPPADDEGRLLPGWYPRRIVWEGAQGWVEWCFVGDTPLTDPFYEQTLNRCAAAPFNRLLRLRSPLDTLPNLLPASTGCTPSGFVFHLSRCGSTWLTQMLAALPDCRVLSEPQPIDDVLRSHFRNPAMTPERRIQALQTLIALWGPRQHLEEQHWIVKFDAWAALDLPLIRRAFPDVPWVFLYRDPGEVLASHRRQPGMHMAPGVIDPPWFGLSGAMVQKMSPAEYGAWVLGRIIRSVLRFHPLESRRLLHYRELPTAGWARVLPKFGIEVDDTRIAAMQATASRHAKRPYEAFTEDGPAKRAEITADDRTHLVRWTDPFYQALEGARHSGDLMLQRGVE
ncbi:MAG: hypothetical protein AUJ55_00995 [Proteobacteria bacterium CG1_02_64_396]|nr:MAG: hypothetical protein AUJ55_00995 [Proteobacteria bacterium CG1_02_64_396]